MKSRQLGTVLVVAFIDMLGFGLIVPIIPFYAEQFGADPSLIGLLVASYAAAQVVGAPLLGRFSDRYGRRPALLITIACNAVGFLVFGFANALPLLFAGRILSGISGGNLAVAQAYIADITDEKSRAQSLGLIGAALGIGFVVGPLLGGVLSTISYGAPAVAASLLSMLNLVAAVAFLPESLSAAQRAAMRSNRPARSGPALGALTDALKNPRVGPLLNARFFYALAFNLFVTIYPLYAQTQLGLNATQIGVTFAYVGALLVVVQGVLIGRLARQWDENRLLLAMTVLTALALLGWAFAPSLAFLMAVFTLMAFSVGSFTTLINSTLSKAVAPSEVGSMMGLATSLESVTRVFSPSLGGYLLGAFGPWSPGVLGAVILALLALFTLRAFAREPQRVAV